MAVSGSAVGNESVWVAEADVGVAGSGTLHPLQTRISNNNKKEMRLIIYLSLSESVVSASTISPESLLVTLLFSSCICSFTTSIGQSSTKSDDPNHNTATSSIASMPGI